MDILVKPAERPFSGKVTLPLSKSISTRLLMLHYYSKGTVKFNELSDAGDVLHLQQLLNTLRNGYTGSGPTDLHAGDGAAVARFAMCAAAITPGMWRLNGNQMLLQRPMGMLVDGLKQLGVKIQWEKEEGCLPVIIEGKQLSGGEITLDGSTSSQHISGIAMMATQLAGGVKISLTGNEVSIPYLQMTLELMRRSGIAVSWDQNEIYVRQSEFNTITHFVEPDWSATAFMMQLVSSQSAGEIVIPGLSSESVQGDSAAIEYFRSFGVGTLFADNGVRLNSIPSENNQIEISLKDHPDMLPALALAAASRKMKAVFLDVGNLAIKESDRLKSVNEGLKQLGIQSEYDNQSFTVHPSQFKTNGIPRIETYGDHRIAMAFAILTTSCGPLLMTDAECVSKSWPGFWEELERMGFSLSK